MFMFRELKLKMNKMENKEVFFRKELAELLKRYDAELCIEDNRVCFWFDKYPKIPGATPITNENHVAESITHIDVDRTISKYIL